MSAQTMAEMADAFAQILMNAPAPEYLEVALKHVREWAKSPDTREDVREFLKLTEAVPEEAIVALTKDGIRLLTDDSGNLLQFA